MLVKYLSSDREETKEEASQCQKNIRSKYKYKYTTA